MSSKDLSKSNGTKAPGARVAATVILIGVGTLAFGQQSTSVPPLRDHTDLKPELVTSITSGGSGPSSPNFYLWGKLASRATSALTKQGSSVALSANGKWALVGAPGDNGGQGAAWVYANDGGQWVPTGPKLTATNANGRAELGYSVALSADGNTALVGGPYDNQFAVQYGAAWVFTRNAAGYWDHGTKLAGAFAETYNCTVGGPVPIWCGARQGYSVALSADGNTAVIGGDEDNGGVGAIWVFSRKGGAWNQVQNKLVGSGAAGLASQGTSVAVSSDGTTILVGGDADGGGAGAAWVFRCLFGTCLQQGPKLTATGAVGKAAFGNSVALSASGTTAIMGGSRDNSGAGAVWVFTLGGGLFVPETWSQQAKISAHGAAGPAALGAAVAISPDGKTLVAGGPDDNSQAGAVWVFTGSGSNWTQNGNKVPGPPAEHAAMGSSVALSATATGSGDWLLAGGPLDNNNGGAVWAFYTR